MASIITTEQAYAMDRASLALKLTRMGLVNLHVNVRCRLGGKLYGPDEDCQIRVSDPLLAGTVAFWLATGAATMTASAPASPGAASAKVGQGVTAGPAAAPATDDPGASEDSAISPKRRG